MSWLARIEKRRRGTARTGFAILANRQIDQIERLVAHSLLHLCITLIDKEQRNKQRCQIEHGRETPIDGQGIDIKVKPYTTPPGGPAVLSV
jgi:hypothetical protein